MATTGTANDGEERKHYLYKEGTKVDTGTSYDPDGTYKARDYPSAPTMHAVLHLNAGERVCVHHGTSSDTFDDLYSAFSGALLSVDP